MGGRTFQRMFLAALVAASLITACSSGGGNDKAGSGATAGGAGGGATSASTTGGSSSKVADGCTIVTAADAQAVFGTPMKQAESTSYEPPQVLTKCIWQGSDSSSMNLLQFRVWNGKVFFAPDQFKGMAGFEQINGLGEGAYAYGTASFDLNVLTGDRMVSLGASGFNTSDRARVRQAVLDIAAKVLDRV